MPGTLDPDGVALPDRQPGKGYGTRSLGPGDTSDSGSDMKGASGLAGEPMRSLGGGTTSDLDESAAHHTAGQDVGDANLDSDSDAAGTGEHAAAGRDTDADEGRDIDTDHTFSPGTPAEETMEVNKTPTDDVSTGHRQPLRSSQQPAGERR